MGTDSLDSATSRPDPKATIKVLIMDDYAVVRQGLCTFLELQDDLPALPIKMVGEATNGVEAVDLARRLQPDVVLRPGLAPDGWRPGHTPDRREQPSLSGYYPDQLWRRGLGVPGNPRRRQGYLLKDIAPNDLIQAVRAAYLGQVQLHPGIARKLMSAIATKDAAASRPGILPSPRADPGFERHAERS